MSFEKETDGTYTLNVIHDHGSIPLELNAEPEGLQLGGYHNTIPWNVIDELRSATFSEVNLITNIDLLELWPATDYDLGTLVSPINTMLNIAFISENPELAKTCIERRVFVNDPILIRVVTPSLWGCDFELVVSDSRGGVILRKSLRTRAPQEIIMITPVN